MPFTHPFRYGLLSLLAVLGMVGIVSVPPDTASGLLAGRMLELHLLLELFAIVIAALVVTVSWHTLDRQLDHSANALLAGFVVVIGCDLMHALTYEGMPPLLTESSTPQAIFFWLMGRSFEVLTLGAVAAGLAPRWPRSASLGIGLAELRGDLGLFPLGKAGEADALGRHSLCPLVTPAGPGVKAGSVGGAAGPRQTSPGPTRSGVDCLYR